MRNRLILAALIVGAAAVHNAHHQFIKLGSYSLKAQSAVKIPISNSRFVRSENAITRDRVADISVISAPGRTHIDTTLVGMHDALRCSVAVGRCAE